MRTILIALFALILLGCESSLDRQHREALGRLEAVDNEELVKGVALILALPEEQKTFDLPRDLWTPEIVKLEPVAVRYYGDGVAILIKKWVSKESGFYVAPGGGLNAVQILKLEFDERSQRRSTGMRFNLGFLSVWLILATYFQYEKIQKDRD